MHGKTKHVAVRCDESDGGHSWDVWRGGAVVWQGFTTRARARAMADLLDDEDIDEIASDTARGEGMPL